MPRLWAEENSYYVIVYLGEVVYSSKFQQSGNAVEETHKQKPIKGSRVTNFGQISAGIQADCRQSQNCCYAQAYTI